MKPAKFKHFVYGIEGQLSDGRDFLGDRVFSSSFDAEQYIFDNIKPELLVNYNAKKDLFEITDERGNLKGEVWLKTFSYYD